MSINLVIFRKILFIIIVLISCLCNLNRSDYNIALFTFLYLLWDQKNSQHKIRLTYLVLFSFIIDLVWLIQWGQFWSLPAFDRSWSKSLNTFTLIINSINLVVKLAAIIVIFLQDQQIRHSYYPSAIFQNIKAIIIHTQPTQDAYQY